MIVIATNDTQKLIDEITDACANADQVLLRSLETLPKVRRFQSQLQQPRPAMQESIGLKIVP